MTILYCIEYDSSQLGCPPYLSGEFNYPDFEWEPLSPYAADSIIQREYKFNLKTKNIDFDYYSGLRLVSHAFINICEQLKSQYRAVPVTLKCKSNHQYKNYYLLLLKEHIEVLDRKKSIYIDAHDPRTGLPIDNKLYPNAHSYDKIEKFVIQEKAYPPIFVCIETGALFCNSELKKELQDKKIKGLKFREVDETYIYDPFGELFKD